MKRCSLLIDDEMQKVNVFFTFGYEGKKYIFLNDYGYHARYCELKCDELTGTYAVVPELDTNEAEEVLNSLFDYCYENFDMAVNCFLDRIPTLGIDGKIKHYSVTRNEDGAIEITEKKQLLIMNGPLRYAPLFHNMLLNFTISLSIIFVYAHFINFRWFGLLPLEFPRINETLLVVILVGISSVIYTLIKGPSTSMSERFAYNLAHINAVTLIELSFINRFATIYSLAVLAAALIYSAVLIIMNYSSCEKGERWPLIKFVLHNVYDALVFLSLLGFVVIVAVSELLPDYFKCYNYLCFC